MAVPPMSGAEYPNRAVTAPTRGLMASCTNAFEANSAPENGDKFWTKTYLHLSVEVSVEN